MTEEEIFMEGNQLQKTDIQPEKQPENQPDEKPGRKRRKPPRPIRLDNANLFWRLLELLLVSLVVALVVEGLNQGSVNRMINYLRERPLYFAYNVLIVFTTFSLTELFSHRRAITLLMAIVWIVLGFANFLVCLNRTQPLVSGDMRLTTEIFGMITVYFSWPQILLMFVGVLAVIAGIMLLYSHTRQRPKVNRFYALGTIAAISAVTVCLALIGIRCNWFPNYYADRVDSYHDYGFATCFTFTAGGSGISKPNSYSTEAVTEILDEIDEPSAAVTEAPAATPAVPYSFTAEDNLNHPNIVYVQLESFFDVDTVVGAEFTRDPTPNYHELLDSCPSGLLYVPTIGGGTANVEFEVMSGMNMDYFGTGEVPYNTIIQKVTCETIADTLRLYGYTSTALHNNTGTFFSRNEVYANLGYDRFDSLEYMLYPTYNALGYAKDTILTQEITEAVSSTETRDLIFAITMESHGKYAETYTPQPGNVEILSLPQDAFLAPFQNYVNTIASVDTFIGEIINVFSAYDEPTIVIFYGDHLPALGLSRDMLTTNDLYASRYIIWNNYDAEFEAPDLQAYRLSANLFKQMGITDGVLTKFHQSYDVNEESEGYIEQLKILEYDMLYGEQNAYGEHGPYAPTELQLGIRPITIINISTDYGRMLVTGTNFTEYSKLIVNNVLCDTIYIDAQHIATQLPEGLEETGISVCVAQINADGKELSRTELYGD